MASREELDAAYEFGRSNAGVGLDEAVAEGLDLIDEMTRMAQDLMKEMSELDPNDERYELNYEQYRGMLSRCD